MISRIYSNISSRSGALSTLPITLSAVGLLVFLAYLKCLGNDFINLDDPGYVLLNGHIQVLDWETLRWACTQYEMFWMPLTWLSFAVDHAAWGLDPKGYHLTNIVLHSLNAILVSYLSVQLLELWQERLAAPDGAHPPPLSRRSLILCGALAGLFFALHPMRVESVAWVAERKDVLNGFFGIASLICYLGYAKRERATQPGRRYLWYGACFFLMAFSLLAKSMTATWPAVMLLLDWYPLRRFKAGRLGRLFLEKIPFVALSAAVASLALLTVKSAGILASTSLLPMHDRLFLALDAVTAYLGSLAYPVGLVPLHHIPANFHPTLAGSLGELALLVGVTLGCLLLSTRSRAPLAAWLFFLVTLTPVLGIIQQGPQSMADRFTYLPSIALALLLAGAVGRFLSRPGVPGLARAAAVAAVVALLFCYLALTESLIGIWHDSGTFWTRIITASPTRMGRAYLLRAVYYREQGRHLEALKDLDLALEIARRTSTEALPRVYSTRAGVYETLGRLPEALADYSLAIERSAGLTSGPLAYSPRGDYQARGEILLKLGRNAESQQDFARAQALGDPEGEPRMPQP